MPRSKAACFTSEGDQWYTPAPVIALARRILGEIDLDPASCPEAQRVVRAARYYAVGGLALPWQGRVWCNRLFCLFGLLRTLAGLQGPLSVCCPGKFTWRDLRTRSAPPACCADEPDHGIAE